MHLVFLGCHLLYVGYFQLEPVGDALRREVLQVEFLERYEADTSAASVSSKPFARFCFFLCLPYSII